jgi:hypothetical protein
LLLLLLLFLFLQLPFVRVLKVHLGLLYALAGSPGYPLGRDSVPDGAR